MSRVSCNGLPLRCSKDCTIRPCLQWIDSPDSQANATLFLAKFYGRAGLLNLNNAGPQHLRPALFRSLLYEVCGRIVNPIHGSAGLMWSENWAKCQAAVEAVLMRSSITIMVDDVAALHSNTPLKTCDIRHVSKEPISFSGLVSRDLHKVQTRVGFKRSVSRPKPDVCSGLSHDYSRLSLQHGYGLNRQESENFLTVETLEVNHGKPKMILEFNNQINDDEVGLELTLGLAPVQSH